MGGGGEASESLVGCVSDGMEGVGWDGIRVFCEKLNTSSNKMQL